ncbi:MAG: glycosyltransferase [Candidatus Eremiobacteraeota bacterium]|nr:glycosyltransferase [Candidatus Eremiobacteraeota bacterium]
MERPVGAAPIVSIVTPTLNAERFIDATIQSVLAQTYSPIEFLVVDGGSTDATATIVKGHGSAVTFLPLPGSSQAQAVNAGFRQSVGRFFTFLNADDTLSKDAISSAVALLECHPDADVAYGEGEHVDERGLRLGPYPVGAFTLEALQSECTICQPATLIRRDAFERVGGLDESLHYALDYDLWIRLARQGCSAARSSETWAFSRMHPENKTIGRRSETIRETIAVLRKHYGYVPFNWAHALAGYLVDGKDQFFTPPSGSIRRTLLTACIGMRENSGKRSMFLKEFFHEIGRLTVEARRG